MKYPKPVMTLSELHEMGYPKSALRDWSKMDGFPKVTTPRGGKILVYTQLFHEWLQEIEERKTW